MSSNMPRRSKPIPHTRYTIARPSAKKRYPSRQAATRAITEIRKYQPDLELSVYQIPGDPGWYLTSKSTS